MLLRASTNRSEMLLVYSLVTLAILGVGAIDHLTGSDIHVISLYFIPLAFAGWQLRRTGAAIASLMATITWLSALYTTGVRYSHESIWLINFLSQGVGFLAVSQLVATLAESLRKEQQMGRTDTLTGLKNRQGLIEQANTALSLCKRHSRSVCVAYLDLDNFKCVNDTKGHDFGDHLLFQCGQIIEKSLRASDIAARLGGDEFVVFLPDTNAENSVVLMERIRNSLETSTDFKLMGVTASIGIIFEEKSASDIHQLLSMADAEMYRVKHTGKNSVGGLAYSNIASAA